ncbi:ATP-binding protein [Thermobifida halotolerans]|uniref:ATP-binding protein n=1 Tax=Thermobifida halotolerans TaxID=483545 RepID=A0A399FWS2_9ACTN|nr:protein DpdH [Thermobifida halotolerans]UOE21081.1 ATP-binding protein [Thermobifida halotolerans]
MADVFRGYLCWDLEKAATTINTEAVSPSAAVFLATHAPLRIRRSHIQGRDLVSTDTMVNEHEVLRDFLERRPDTGTLLMPIIGDSGSGKSHLVRWVKERFPRSDRHHVIYLEKAKTSLKAVIETLLEGVNDKNLDRLREDIRSFSTRMDAEALARRLVNSLNEALAATKPAELSGAARALAGPGGLAILLQDPHIQEHMLQQDKFIPQFAERLLHDRREGVQERPPAFTVDDLPLNVNDVGQAAQVSQKLLKLLLSRSELRTAAVDLLNKHWEAAVKSVSSLSSGRLHEAMLQVRQAYARQGKEIVLLIEDFALIQGVQRDLLDAITEAANRYGNAQYAPIRTLMAVTKGYFREFLPETAISRISAATMGYVYDLDVPFNETDTGTEVIASFVGRYLNAARVGRTELERRGPDDVPNACEECPFQEPCHEGFGATAEGYGLYPFNRSALVRTVHSVAPKEEPWAFVPRTVLGSVIRPVLVEHADALAKGAFPDNRFRDRFPLTDIDSPLPENVGEFVAAVDELDGERRKNVLEMWADAPHNPHHVPPTVLEAFGLPPLPQRDDRSFTETASLPKPRNTAVESAPKSTAPETDIPASIRRKLQTISDWNSRKKLLPQEEAREIRTIIVDTIRRRYLWLSPPLREQSTDVIRRALPPKSTSVSIEGANAENLPGVENAPVRFRRTAANSLFFQNLILANNNVGRPRSEDMRRLASFAEEKTDVLMTAIQRHLGTSDDDLVLGLRASLLGAALAGQATPDMTEPELLSAAFDYGQDWERGDTAIRSAGWTRTLGRHLEHRKLLVDTLRSSLGVAQGTGSVRMIDAARALPLLRRATEKWEWELEGRRLPEWMSKAVGNFSSWNQWMEEHAELLRGRLQEIRRRLPRGVNGRETVKAVETALNEARKVGLLSALSPGDLARLQELLPRLAKANWQVVSHLETDLERAANEKHSPNQRRLSLISAVTRDRGSVLTDIQEFLTISDRWLDSALVQATNRSGSLGDAAARELQEVMAEWASLISQEGEQDR